DKHIKEARELFEASQESDFYTLMRAWQFAKKNQFNAESCRRYGVHGQTARQVEQTFEQITRIAQQHGLIKKESASESETSAAIKPAQDPLPYCLMTGFIDQLCVRRDQGTLECDLTEGRHGTLMRESVVQNAPLFVAGTIREVSGRGSENLTLLGLATAVKRGWIEAAFPEQVTARVEHLFDRGHRRVAAVKLIRFRDLVIHHEHQRDVDPAAAGECLADAYLKGHFELALKHETKQFIARANLVAVVMPDLEFPKFDPAALKRCLAQAFSGRTLAKETREAPVHESITKHLAKEQVAWLDELTPLSIPWPDGRKLKLLYPEQAMDEDGAIHSPELQIKIHECFGLKEHPKICEGLLPVRLWLCSPDGKRIESTTNWPAFKTNTYPKLKPLLQKKFPGTPWI
ncbi:MAG TPA: ATP-dependent helicase C-terminal domain-containing protein, partial [Verrucomicrobiae bacterium]|nr:ATP-dependent helicase C-terminal domain-containing protein [Verrucomicrobiae bacterium]